MLESTGSRLVLVDGSGSIFRAFFALAPLTRPNGVPVGAVFGICNMLFRLVRDMPGEQLDPGVGPAESPDFAAC